jgi:hypothetical protein
MRLVEWLWEKLTGQSYWTGRCASQEFGPSIAAQHAGELAALSDAALYAWSPCQWAQRARAQGHRVVLVDVDDVEYEVYRQLEQMRRTV